MSSPGPGVSAQGLKQRVQQQVQQGWRRPFRSTDCNFSLGLGVDIEKTMGNRKVSELIGSHPRLSPRPLADLSYV